MRVHMSLFLGALSIPHHVRGSDADAGGVPDADVVGDSITGKGGLGGDPVGSGDLMKGMGDLGGLGDLFGGEEGGGMEKLKKLMESMKGMEGMEDMFKNLGGMGGMGGMGDMGRAKQMDVRSEFCLGQKSTGPNAVLPVPKKSMFLKGNILGESDAADAAKVKVANTCPDWYADLKRNSADAAKLPESEEEDGLETTSEYGLDKCCGGQSQCYSVCDAGIRWCNREMKSCMVRACKKLHGKKKDTCNEIKEKLVQKYDSAAGNSVYLAGQEASCEATCAPKDKAKEAFRKLLAEFYKEHSPAQAHDVDTTLAKYKNKEGQLWMALLTKYGVPNGLVESKGMGEDEL